ncbi:Citrate synthase (si) [Labilithrix luteola]|uniref:Citrate synthase (Si) n=1 Tax=Labilithrix luteola TaxID=1391654 RepID=A0A0K1PQV4_9BACT|nr:hypothetical protein [Labilithrix luteola]AKU95925.1 Citrate synthase (si) [Labilithrix luteola]
MDEIRTHVGRAIHGDYEHFGLRVFRDLLGHTSYLGLIAFAISGRRLSRDDEQLLDDLAVTAHVTEPRVWPIKLTRVVASLGRTMPAFVSGVVALDSDIVGGRVANEATRVLTDLAKHVEQHGETDASIADFVVSRKRLVGFGVPFRETDERLDALRAVLERRGRAPGKYWTLAERFWRIVKEKRGVEANIIGGTAAVCLDLGFNEQEASAMAVTLLQPTFLSNAVEGAAQKSAVLRQLPDEAMRYAGAAPRKSPRALAAEASGKGTGSGV